MDNDVQQFRQNAREGQWCPIGSIVRPGRVLISLPQSAPVKQDGSYRTIQERTYNASYKESSGQRLSSSKRLSQGKEKVSGCFGYLALGGPGRRGCPRLTLHEELHRLDPSVGVLRVCPNQPHAGASPGWSRHDRGPQPLLVSQSDTIWNGLYRQAVIPRVWNRALVTVMSNAGW